MTWAVWDDLAADLQADDDIRRVANEGHAILRAHDKLVRQVIDTSKRRMIIGGYDVPVAAAPYALASDTAGTMAEGEPFAATYVDGPKGRAFSLRSRGDGMDVSQIAATFGGGGHRNAAGFLMPLGWEGDADPMRDLTEERDRLRTQLAEAQKPCAVCVPQLEDRDYEC